MQKIDSIFLQKKIFILAVLTTSRAAFQSRVWFCYGFFCLLRTKRDYFLGGVKENNSTYTTLFQRHFSLCWNGTVATFFHLKSNNVFNLDTLEISAAFPTLSGRKILFKVVQKKIVELIKSNTDFWKQKKSANIFVNEAYTKNLL